MSRGNTTHEILSVATDLHETAGPDGTTVYTGTIRTAHVDPQGSLGEDDVTRMIEKLRGGGASDRQAPGGRYADRSKLTLIAGHDGLVKRISFTFHQPSCRPGLPNCPEYGPATRPGTTITWSVLYSHLGDNQPISAPDNLQERHNAIGRERSTTAGRLRA
jgi:hypothetical protein